MKKIAIIGAGPGGLSAGLILSNKGYNVTIYEKDHVVGGRNQALKLGNFRFDTGPTFLMYVQTLEKVFEQGGYHLYDELDLIELDPLYRLMFDDITFDLSSKIDRNIDTFNQIEEGLGNAYQNWLSIQAKKLKAFTPLLERPFNNLFSYIRFDIIKALGPIDIFNTIYSSLQKLSSNETFIHGLSFQAKYLGMSSMTAPSVFSFLSYLEHSLGLYHIKGGLNKISEKMAELIKRNGGQILLDTKVKKVITRNKKAVKLELDDNSVIEADHFILNADFAYAMTDLFKDSILKKYSKENLEKKSFSVSTINFYFALDTLFDLPHHQIIFSKNYNDYLRRLSNNKFTKDLSLYVHNPSLIDETLAPKGHSALYVLLPVPNLRNKELDWESLKHEIEEFIYSIFKEKLDINLRDHILDKKIVSPLEWKSDYHVYEGATFNLSHNLKQMMHMRPHNKFEEIKNMYLVGGGTHPGSGLPTIYQSALITTSYFK
jgi:phytoene desaturase